MLGSAALTMTAGAALPAGNQNGAILAVYADFQGLRFAVGAANEAPGQIDDGLNALADESAMRWRLWPRA